ncbi:MAG TPA: class I SAM-dependent methyltransferase [Chitinispirillaceae bacterium]|nr:class I SAM-dependent methyltransferase [Chitinispirillaceae bacterium]
MQKYIDGNREAWNTASLYHQKAMADVWMQGFTKPGYTSFDEFDYKLYKHITFEGKSVFQAPCNNGREILSFINMGAVEGVGFDISDENINFSNKLKSISGLKAEFYRTNVYEISNQFNNQFDIGIISAGSIMWMPDLKGYFQIYRRLLKSGGILFIYEMHPLTTAYPYSFRKNDKIEFETSYFTKGVIVTNDSLDYYGNAEYVSPPQYNFQYPISKIIQTLIDLNFAIKEFKEYPHDLGGGHVYLEGKIPLCYHIWADKNC